jgi:CheY-like chemotaxis protein
LVSSLLIADDNPIIRQKVRHLFELDHEWNEWSVAEAADGRDAVEKATELKLDLVVLDFAMPVMNGLEAAALIRRTSPRLPLILFTAYKDGFLEKAAFEKGFSVVVSKGEAANRLVDSARILVRYGRANAEGQPQRKQVTEGVSAPSDGALREGAPVDVGRQNRVMLDAEVTIYSEGHGSMPARVSEISESGFAATLPLELLLGEVVIVEIHLPFAIKRVKAVIRNRKVFRHGFELLPTTVSEEMERLRED